MGFTRLLEVFKNLAKKLNLIKCIMIIFFLISLILLILITLLFIILNFGDILKKTVYFAEQKVRDKN